jgi:hypothetical protein
MESYVNSVHAAHGLQLLWSGGGGGIRTPETLSGLTVFKTAAFNHSATPPLPFFAFPLHTFVAHSTFCVRRLRNGTETKAWHNVGKSSRDITLGMFVTA